MVTEPRAAVACSVHASMSMGCGATAWWGISSMTAMVGGVVLGTAIVRGKEIRGDREEVRKQRNLLCRYQTLVDDQERRNDGSTRGC
jgi:hypothetical protein